jgi:hypothetical protein
MFLVFQNIDPPPPLRPVSVYPPPWLGGGGGGGAPRRGGGGGGVGKFCETSHNCFARGGGQYFGNRET